MKPSIMWRKGLIYCVVILAMLSCRVPFDLLGRREAPPPAEPIEEIAVVVSTEDVIIPTETATPTITETPEPNETPTMDLRVIEIGPRALLLVEQDLPYVAEYYPEYDLAQYPNSEVLSGEEAGSLYLEETQRIDGWNITYFREPSAERVPDEITHSLTQFETADGALLGITKYLFDDFDTDWIVSLVDDDYPLGDKSFIMEITYYENGTAMPEYFIFTSYRNYVSIVSAFGGENDFDLEFVIQVAEIAIDKLMAAPLTNPMDTPDTTDLEEKATPFSDTLPDSDKGMNPRDSAGMVFVPAGEFLMGLEGSGAEEDEGPEHMVYLDAFWLYETPVTNSQYRQCIEAGGCTGTLSRFPDDQYPVTRIDWRQAGAYCEWAGGRLPTEAEWEKGARGTDGRLFPWGNESPNCNLANYQGCYSNKVTEVGRFPEGASPYGALDMLGLVWEWVSDWYDEDYYTYSPAQNPTGPVEGQFRGQRGHSFESNLIYLRITDRGRSDPTSVDYRKGFRCVIPDLP